MPNDNVIECCDLIKSYINDSPFRNKIIELVRWVFLLSADFDKAPSVKYYPNRYGVHTKELTGRWIGFFLESRNNNGSDSFGFGLGHIG